MSAFAWVAALPVV